MTIEEIIYKFITDIEAQTGVSNPVIKIGVDPQIYSRLTYETYKKYMTPIAHTNGEMVLFGVQILPRKKDLF